MKKGFFFNPTLTLCIFALLHLFAFTAYSQTREVYGKVSDNNAHPLAGASVVIKGTAAGTKTNEHGEFSLKGAAAGDITLLVSYIGFKDKEVKVSAGAVSVIAITLEEKAGENDIIVITGVFDKRKKMEASVAISTITEKQIAKIVPVSAADLLKNVPGVYVNSSLGEIRNTVYSRGVSVGSNDGASGYYYVSMQEDGLPVTNATYGNYGPDYFLRSDATLGRLEAVRGGTASILGNNAPGGIFNYIMKEGGDVTSGEVRTRYGREGNGRNNYYRTDLNIGGPLGKNFYYDIGGFYRYAEGARYPGYPLNHGGQLRGNITKKYNTGSLKLYAKYLNDHNGWFEFTPTVDFANPKPAPGFTEYSSVLSRAVRQSFPLNETGETKTYDNKDQIHSQDKALGLNWEQRLGNGFSITNAMRYSYKTADWNTNAIVYPLNMTDLTTYALLGMLGSPGTYSFRNLTTGQELMNVTSYSGYDYNLNNSSLPGNEIAPNSLFFEPLMYREHRVKEFIDQFAISKKWENMSITAGAFYAGTKINYLNGVAGVGLATIQDKPEFTGITLKNPDNSISHVTNSNGIFGVGGGGLTYNYATQKQLAVFFGHNWQITPALNLDWGIRYEAVAIKGNNKPAVASVSTTGGPDGDPLTLFDNGNGITPITYYFDKTINTFSHSAGLNYKINNNFSLYGRYSQGKKAPDVDIYFNANTDFASKSLNPIAQKVQQAEFGIKTRKNNLNLFITPFYSLLSNVASVQSFTNADQTSYSPPFLYNKYRTIGIEMEGDYTWLKHFNTRAVLTVQKGKALDYNVWLARDLGAADDTIVSLSGNETDNLARTLLSVTQSYNSNKFFAQLTWSFMGKRQANVANAFLLPSFSQFNFSTGYDVSRKLNIGLVINNIFNTYGVMSWSRPGGFIEALDRQGFTKEMFNKAVSNNSAYSTTAIPARAYFVSATFKF